MRGVFLAASAIKDASKVASEKSSGSGFKIDVQILGFQDPKTMRLYDKFGSDVQCLVRVHNVENLAERQNSIRINSATGVREVYSTVNYAEDAKQYILSHIPEAVEGKYKGNFVEILNYWDANKKCLASHAWFPLHDAAGNGISFSVKLWPSPTAKIPTPDELKLGSVVTINGYFNQYVSLPKLSSQKKAGGSAATSKNGAAAVPAATQAPQAPHAPAVAAVHEDAEDADDADDGDLYEAKPATTAVAAAPAATAAVTKDFRSPNIRLSLCTNHGMELSCNNSSDATSLQIFGGAFDDRKHFCALPSTDSDAAVLVVPLHGYQNTFESADEFELGPSTVRFRQISLEGKAYEKPPKGQPLESPAREAKLDISVFVCQYGAGKCDPTKNLPVLIFGTAYQDQIWGTGITYPKEWLKYGRLDWQGICLMQVNAPDTRRNEYNLSKSKAEKDGLSGVINCYVKTILWDVDATVRKEGVLVDKELLLSSLYADIYSDAENKKTGKRTVLFPLDQFPNRTLAPSNHPLHKYGRNSPVLLLNEYNSDAGWIMMDDSLECYVVPYLPNPTDKKLEDSFAYRASALQKLRALDPGEKLVNVLTGKETLKGVVTYHPDELEALNATEEAEERAKGLPGRGEVPRQYPDGVDATKVSTYGFDFLVFILKKRVAATDSQQGSAVAAAAAAAAGGSKKNKKQNK
jgi:hypothetical protein